MNRCKYRGHFRGRGLENDIGRYGGEFERAGDQMWRRKSNDRSEWAGMRQTLSLHAL